MTEEEQSTMDLPIHWISETHVGVIRHLQGTTADGVVHDLGIWTYATEKKSGRTESAIPYDSIDAAMKRLTEKYPGFHVVTEPDVVAMFESQEVGNRAS
jgi:hypothetical protein